MASDLPCKHFWDFPSRAKGKVEILTASSSVPVCLNLFVQIMPKVELFGLSLNKRCFGRGRGKGRRHFPFPCEKDGGEEHFADYSEASGRLTRWQRVCAGARGCFLTYGSKTAWGWLRGDATVPPCPSVPHCVPLKCSQWHPHHPAVSPRGGV